MRILIIEDDLTLNQVLTQHLQHCGYEVISTPDGQRGLVAAHQHHPDLIILDVMMPGMDGWQTCQRLRELSAVPIIMLTAKGSDRDVIRGLQLGADDYIKKPFNLQELELRIEAVLRRTPTEDVNRRHGYKDKNIYINLSKRLVERHGKAVHLTPTEYRLLDYLFQHRDRVIPHEELLTEVWGPRYAGDTASLSVYIRYLREKLEEDPSQPEYILTNWGVGYRFRAA